VKKCKQLHRLWNDSEVWDTRSSCDRRCCSVRNSEMSYIMIVWRYTAFGFDWLFCLRPGFLKAHSRTISVKRACQLRKLCETLALCAQSGRVFSLWLKDAFCGSTHTCTHHPASDISPPDVTHPLTPNTNILQVTEADVITQRRTAELFVTAAVRPLGIVKRNMERHEAASG
jgi:hypothetical protein